METNNEYNRERAEDGLKISPPSASELKAEALKLYNAGFSVIPTIAYHKRPAVRWAPYEKRRASTAEIESWWSERAGRDPFGLAVVEGPISGDVALDFDPKEGSSVDDLIDEAEAHFKHFFPETCRVRTCGGGYHDHYILPPNVDGGPVKVIFSGKHGKIEYRAGGSICVMPPTLALGKLNQPGTYRYVTPLEKRIDITTTWVWKVITQDSLDEEPEQVRHPQPSPEEIHRTLERVRPALSKSALKYLTLPPRRVRDRSKLCYQFGLEVMKSGIRNPYVIASLIMALPTHKDKYNDPSRGKSWDEWGHAWKLACKLVESAVPQEGGEKDRQEEERKYQIITFKELEPTFRSPEFVLYPLLPRREITLLDGDDGTGKAIAINTLIPTPDGFKEMRDISVGDVVYDGTGRPTTVTYVSPVYYNHKCYKVTFDDGTEVIADADHLWLVQTARQRENTRRWRNNPKKATWNKQPGYSILTTEEMAQSVTFELSKGHVVLNYSVDIKPFQGQHRELPIPPYTFGVWLGDGTAREAQITTADEEIIKHIESEGIPVKEGRTSENNGKAKVYWLSSRDHRNSVRTALRRLGVLNNKHIPKEYLFGSFEQRLALLQGLMDTNGHVSKKGACEFVTTNKQLAEQVRTLICSLGIKCFMHQKQASGFGTTTTAYRIIFSTAIPVFRLERKKPRLPKSVSPRSLRRYIVSIEPVDSVPVKCIAVDSPERTYMCTDRFLITHNTWVCLALIAGLTGSKICPVPYDNFAPKDIKALILTAEDDPSVTLGPRLRDLGADLSRVSIISPVGAEFINGITVSDLYWARDAIAELAPDLIVVDHITIFEMTADVDSAKTSQVRRVLDPLKEIARELNCAVLVVRHFRKSSGSAKDRGSGSVMYRATSRSHLVVGFDPEDESKRIITQVKMNLVPRLKEGLVYSLNESGYPPFTWCGTVDVDPDTLTDPSKAEKARQDKSAKDAAIDLLYEMLGDGQEVPRDEIVKEAKQREISSSTVYRAANEIGVLTKQAGFGKEKRSLWSLPPKRRIRND